MWDEQKKERYNSRMEKEVLNRVLLPLADQFEAGNRNRWCTFKPGEVNEYEKLRGCMAD
jgi:hypothetical protein